MAVKQAKLPRRAQRTEAKIKRKSELSIRRELLSQFPGYNINKTDFDDLIRQSYGKSN